MKIGEINLILFKKLEFGRLRFFDPHNHFCFFKNIFGRRDDLSACIFISSIREPAGVAGILLYQNRMPILPHELNAPGRQGHAIFFCLVFF